MREKDANFVRILFRHRLIELRVLTERAKLLDARAHPVQAIIEWARRRAKEAATP